ncbi:phosphoribosylglycinamide formyltransferase [Hydrogenovibrio kuenenii]|uniref:phosphoribosylglycinamide formyltransferase n=1 Tax=Hydrogenovibrio kuenenii TaxID=63658 RepID=UPI000464CA34|nr:phosphoribosylglycinamide formyltransferase [Hydrogenovibrio kuenenii]
MTKNSNKMPIAVLISGNGSNLQALIDAQPTANYEIKLVISNRPSVKGIERAQNAGISTLVLDHKAYDSREAFDLAMIEALDSKHIKAVILAGFMRILTPEFTSHFLGRMLNIHPSLLPKYPGLDTHQKALDAGDKEHGLSIHFVTAELDGGPVILQAKVSVDANDNVESLKQKIHALEHQAYPLVADWLASSKVELKDNQVWFNNHLLKSPIDFDQALVNKS